MTAGTFRIGTSGRTRTGAEALVVLAGEDRVGFPVELKGEFGGGRVQCLVLGELDLAAGVLLVEGVGDTPVKVWASESGGDKEGAVERGGVRKMF